MRISHSRAALWNCALLCCNICALRVGKNGVGILPRRCLRMQVLATMVRRARGARYLWMASSNEYSPFDPMLYTRQSFACTIESGLQSHFPPSPKLPTRSSLVQCVTGCRTWRKYSRL